MFFLPLFDNNPTLMRPVITWLIIMLCFVAFVWQITLDQTVAHNIIYQLGFIPAVFFTYVELPENMTLVPECMTIFTSMFLHGGWLHIASNMLYLWIFGDNIEAAMGRYKFILFYFLCGSAAAMAQALLDPTSTVPMIGASGGVAGVLGAYLILHPKAAIRCFFLVLIFFRFINLPAWLVLGIWIGGQFVAIPRAFTDGSSVAYMAHIGGFFAGMALIPFFKNRHIMLLDRGNPQQNWSGHPLNFKEVKTEARERYLLQTSTNGPSVIKKTELWRQTSAKLIPSLPHRHKPKPIDKTPWGT